MTPHCSAWMTCTAVHHQHIDGNLADISMLLRPVVLCTGWIVLDQVLNWNNLKQSVGVLTTRLLNTRLLCCISRYTFLLLSDSNKIKTRYALLALDSISNYLENALSRPTTYFLAPLVLRNGSLNAVYVILYLNHLPWVPHICVTQLGHHWFR